MAKIALIPEGTAEKSEFINNLGLPVNYMEDFSVLGIVVDRYQDSVAVLKKSGFIIESLKPGAIIGCADPSGIATDARSLKHPEYPLQLSGYRRFVLPSLIIVNCRQVTACSGFFSHHPAVH